MHRFFKFGVAAALCLGFATARAAVFTVINANDAGPGSLREAIAVANATAGADEIRFNIAGPTTIIRPLGELPAIDGQCVIDATSQPGYGGIPLVEIDGQGALDVGLGVSGIGVTVRGLWIYGFKISNIAISGLSHIVERCFVTGSRNGPVVAGSPHLINLGGATNCRIGTPGVGNWIAGGRVGIAIQSSHNNMVQANFIGIDLTGAAALPNTKDGVWITGSSTGNLIGGTANGARNIISGNGNGIMNDSSGAINSIVGNYIGTDVAGTRAVPNTENGIFCTHSGHVVIGRAHPAAANLISGNRLGIAVFKSEGATIQGNKIGTDAAGTARLPNMWGITVYGFGVITRNVLIGGSGPGEGNLISGNDDAGIILGGAGTSIVTIQGNKIGTDVTGDLNLFNDDPGIFIVNGPHDILIGGSKPQAANVIAFNRTYGIMMRVQSALPQDGFPRRVRINGNMIHSHGTYNLDIERDSSDKRRSLNDHLDVDDGPNGRQNYPDLNTPTFLGTNMRVTGSLDSVPNKQYLIEFFTSHDLGTNNQPQARIYAGSVSVTTNAQGAANLSITIPAGKFGRYVTATATDPDGNTSEFSVPVTAPSAAESAWMVYN